MATPKQKKSDQNHESIFLYDADVQQEIPLTVENNGRTSRVVHYINPLPDSRFFQLELELSDAAKGRDLSASAFFRPKHKLWKELTEKRAGYRERADWKEQTHVLDAVGGINALLYVKAIQPNHSLDTEKEILVDEDLLSEVWLQCLFSGVLLETKHFFANEQPSELDEYIDIKAGRKSRFWEMNGKTHAERYSFLYDGLAKKSEGYKNRVPAWHKIAAITYFFEKQLSKLDSFQLV